MFNIITVKRTAIWVLFFFAVFCMAPQSAFSQAPDKPDAIDKLAQGKERYDLGDYDKSVQLLEAYTSDSQNPREKRAEAYYYLAKNYYVVKPGDVRRVLEKALEADWFLSVDEKDAHFKKVVDTVRNSYLEKIRTDQYLDLAKASFLRGQYSDAKYYYRVAAQKTPSETIETYIKNCDDTVLKKQHAIEQYRKGEGETVYPILSELIVSSPEDEEVKTAFNEIKVQLETEKKDREEKEKAEKAEKEKNDRIQKEAANTIKKEGVKSPALKKKFPILWVALGGVAVVALILLMKKKAATTGTIRVESVPTGAKIWLDGADTEQVTTAILTNVSSGTHAVKVTKDEYVDYDVNITVEAGKQTLVTANLSKAPKPNFLTNTESVGVPEGGQNTFMVKLSEQPLSDIAATVTRQSGDTDITVFSGGNLTFTSSNWNTYQTVTLKAAADDDATNGQTIVRISATNVPDKDIIATEQDSSALSTLAVTPNADFTPSGTVGGPFNPTSKTYTLQNNGTGSIRWTASKNENWINLSGTEGSLGPNASTTVIVSINSNANILSVGNHTDTVTFVNATNGNGNTTRQVTLGITTVPKYNLQVTRGDGVDGYPETGTFSYNQGATVNYNYTLKQGYKNLVVTLDGLVASASGTISMEADHVLSASATAVDDPPDVNISTPADGSEVSGTVTVQADATDDKGINKVEIYIDNALATAVLAAPYTYQWNTLNVADGSHTIRAIAYDTTNQTNFALITVTVKNQ
ncbi:MAG: Ig-like domain-containing protein [Candidatus Omnitrophota bacterium]